MKINNSPSFGSKILYSAKLTKNSFWNPTENIDVFISELEQNDICTILNSNPLLMQTNYGGQALRNYKAECKSPLSELGIKTKFLVVESPGSINADTYKGIAELYNESDILYVKKLQSLNYIPIYKNLKGVGSCLMYAIFKMSQQLDKKHIELTSAFWATDFYRKIGMKQNNYNFKIDNCDFETAAEKLKEKFSIEEVKFT